MMCIGDTLPRMFLQRRQVPEKFKILNSILRSNLKMSVSKGRLRSAKCALSWINMINSVGRAWSLEDKIPRFHFWGFCISLQVSGATRPRAVCQPVNEGESYRLFGLKRKTLSLAPGNLGSHSPAGKYGTDRILRVNSTLQVRTPMQMVLDYLIRYKVVSVSYRRQKRINIALNM